LPSTDPTPDPLPSSPSHDSNISWPIALWKALDHPRWKQAMIVEMQALEQSGTKELDRLKARLVAKGYTQVYGLDYGDTFSPMAKITTIRLLLAMVVIRHWPLHQLDIKNAFLHGDLDEEIYMEQPPGFVGQGESGLVCKLRRSLYGLKQSPRAWFGKFSQYLFSHFQTKDLGHLKYFLGIEVTQSKEGIVISQRKYALDILQETSMSNCRPIDSPMDPNMKLMAPCVDHWTTVLRILKYIKKTPGQGTPIDRRSTTGFCISIGGKVVFWKSKKQNTVARSSAEAEYRVMTSATCELIWVKQLIQELKFTDAQPMKLYCDNQAALHIASNLVFLERTKHIEIDCHFIREKLLAKEISTEFINSSNQLADIFTKSLRGPRIQA
ncbi:Copia protein, partial [Mucuna pruriens]